MHASIRSSRYVWYMTAVAGALLIGTLLLAGCGGDSEASEEEGDTIAYQVGEPISDSTTAIIVSSEYGSDTLSAQNYRRQIDLFMQRIPPNQQTEEQLRKLHRNFVEQFVSRHVLVGEARAESIDPDTARVNMQLRQMRGRFPDEQSFQQALASSNMTEDSLRRMVEERVRLQVMQERMASEADTPSTQEVETYRKEQQSEEVRARHILFRVSENAPEDTVDSVRARAEAILDSAKAGADFAALARRHSEGPTAKRGGDLGYFTKDRMVEPFADAAFALQDSGAVTDELVRTQYGFHIIQLTDRRMQELMDSTRARQALLSERRQQAVEEGRDDLLAKATVRVNPDVVEAGLTEN